MNDNKLIAEFMGFKQPHPEYPHTTYWYKELPNGRLKTLAILNYHISWDWLMPVVEECLSQDDAELEQWGDIYNSLPSCNIDEVYDAVVEFIKEYNKES